AGARFHYQGVPFTVPLPYFAFHWLPVLNAARNPGRFAVVAQLALDALAAFAVIRLGRGNSRRIAALSLAWLAVIMIEFWPPTHRDLLPVRIPRPYAAIAADHRDRA